MAEVPVTINGVICDLYGRTILGPVKIVGSLMKSGVGVGGGPIFPPEGGTPPEGGGDAHPEHPIYYPPYPAHPIAPGGPGDAHPEHPIVLPPDPGWPGSDLHPEHPIVLPPDNVPGPPAEGVKPPPPGGGWGYHPEYGWGYFPGTGSTPGPKK